MSSVITLDFEQWKAQQIAAGNPVVLDEFVFAYVPDLDPSQAINRDEKLPADNHIVHRQAVNKTGLASENAVAYSVTLGTEVGHFDFNWIGLLNKASGVIGMITHAPTQKKIKTANGLQGNVLTRSFLLEFEGAAKETAITTTAETWQIDFTARLTGIDEMQRLMNTDSYGEAAFFDEGFAVVRHGEQYTVKKGLAYVGGLRGILEFDQTLNSQRNTRVYADFSYQGNLVSQWKTVVQITVTNDLQNYIDAAGYPHYVFAVANIDGNGDVMDLRIKGSLNARDIADIQKALGGVKQALEHGLNETQPKGDYATRPEVKEGLEEKQPRGDYATNTALNAVNENASNRLEKSKNGADVPDKDLFNRNIGSCRAFSSGISIGGGGFWTTDEFIKWLKHQGAFDNPYWMCKGMWSYADNRIINDTGCGAIHLAGSVVEVMGYEGAITIRVTTPTTSVEGGTESAQFIYINHDSTVSYRPGWRRDYNTVNKPTAYDVGAYSRDESDNKYLPRYSQLTAEVGLLGINRGNDWPGLMFIAQNGHRIGIEGSLGKILTIWSNDAEGNRRYNLQTPEKSGVLATVDDVNNANNIPVGVPLPWPHANPPAGYLECKGQYFERSQCPKLADAYPSCQLPDLRGEFIRGLDNTRGIDPGRGALSWQNQQVQYHSHLGGHGGRAGGSFGSTTQWEYAGSYNDDTKQPLPITNNGSDFDGFTNNGAVGTETRPRNVAFLYIVRAA
ncbi:hypothetical protein XBO1_2110085 [Xenorhabdus bovienii str. oregonense]|uniref:Uncharacterized protein n=1 Tax=Xenorhabdus bovienii str. oregonense TaxID=1398202 RepID=A0A077NV23_XENBV|nr:phage tail protein [Xenorhabdus bovienii]CDH06082.1 hypothetical protein XBO1_2110085 [Xenorhabdus bovienii str. oregonense]